MHEVKTTNRSRRTGNKFEKIKKMAAETRRIFSAFKDVFWKFSSRWQRLTGLGRIQRKTKKTVFITFFGLKDCGGFKGRREVSRYQVVPFAISANFGRNLSAKVYASENPYKNAVFLVGFLRERPSEIRQAGINRW